jgi:hypothetical protein
MRSLAVRKPKPTFPPEMKKALNADITDLEGIP